MLKTSMLALGALLISGAAQAATFQCTGGLLNYAFTLRGNISGNRAVGSAIASVTQGGAPLRRAVLPIRSSSFVANRRLQITAADSSSRIVINSAFQSGSYIGQMAVNSTEINVNLNVTCRVK